MPAIMRTAHMHSQHNAQRVMGFARDRMHNLHMDPIKALGSAIKYRREKLGLTQPELAERAQVGQTAISRIEGGKQGLSLETLSRLSLALGTRPGYIQLDADKLSSHGGIDDDTSPDDIVSRHETHPGYVRFPLLEGYAGMGPGTFISDYPEVVQELRVSREWVNQKMPGIPHESIRVITGRGDSMKGQYNDGDLIFIDIRIKEFDQDSAYCFRWAGRVQIKRLQLVRPGTIRILSENPKYDSIDTSINEIEIGGRAIAAWTLQDF